MTNHKTTILARTRAVLTAACAALMATAPAAAQETEAPPAPETISAERLAEHIESFDTVWQMIKDRHWDPEVVGESWDQAKIDLRPEVEAATTDAEARRAMTRLLDRTGQSHFNILPAEAYDQLSADGGSGDIGIDARYREGRALVVRVREGSPADTAGITPGWIVTAAGDRDFAAVAEAATTAAEESPTPNRIDTTAGRAFNALMTGSVGSTRTFAFENPAGEPVELELAFEEPPGAVVQAGNLPEMRVSHRTETLDEGIGYFYLSVFFDPLNVMPAYRAALSQHQNAPGFIIDLRGNPGGIISMATGMAGRFVEEKRIQLGVMKLRGQSLNMVINPQRPHFKGRVAVLIDELSASNSEILSAGLRDIGVARIFGANTAGQVLPAQATLLPNGDGFLMAFADYTSESGDRLEGAGVAPDEPIHETQQSLLGGQDPVLQAAIDWILER